MPAKNKELDDYSAYWQEMRYMFPFRAGRILTRKERELAWNVAKHKTHYPEILTWTRRCIETGNMYDAEWPRENNLDWTTSMAKAFWYEGYRTLFDYTLGEYVKNGVSPEFMAHICSKMLNHRDIDALMCLQNIITQLRHLHFRAERNILTSRKEYPFQDDYMPFFSEEGFFPRYPTHDSPINSLGASPHLPVSWMGDGGDTEIVMLHRTVEGLGYRVVPVGS